VNREAQVSELEALTLQFIGVPRLVIRTSLPAAEVIRWPAKNWEALIYINGTVMMRKINPAVGEDPNIDLL